MDLTDDEHEAFLDAIHGRIRTAVELDALPDGSIIACREFAALKMAPLPGFAHDESCWALTSPSYYGEQKTSGALLEGYGVWEVLRTGYPNEQH
jgi:hypothetical protein